MNKLFTNFLMLVSLLFAPIFSAMAQSDIAGDYVADIDVTATAFGNTMKDSAKAQTVSVVSVGNDLYDITFTKLKVSSATLTFTYKNLEYDGKTLSYTANSSIESKDKLEKPSFSATGNEKDGFEGMFAFTYNGGFLTIPATASFVMSIPNEDVVDNNPLVKEYTFKQVQYYNNVNSVDMTKDTFKTFKVSVYKNNLTISAPDYVAKLGDDANLMVKQDLVLANINYKANDDTTVIFVDSSNTVFKIEEYGVSFPAVISASFDLNNDSLNGHFDYKVNSKNNPLIDLVMPGADFNVVCTFGRMVEEIEVEVEKLDFNFDNASHYFSSIPSGSDVIFNHIYYDKENGLLLIYPISISNVAQETALLMDVEVSPIVIDTVFNDVKYNFTNYEVATSGIAKQFIKVGGDFVLVGEQEANLKGILSADEQFVGSAKVLGYSVESKDVKAPVDAIVKFAPAYETPVCGFTFKDLDEVAYIDTVDGFFRYMQEAYIGDQPKYSVFDKAGNSFAVASVRDFIYNKDALYYRDTVLLRYSIKDSYIITVDAREDVERGIRDMFKVECDYKITGLEAFAEVPAPGIDTVVTVGTTIVPVSIKIVIERPNKAKETPTIAKSISYSNGVLNISGYTGEVNIYTILGSKVATKKISSKIALNLPSGIYLVKVGSTTEKIVVR